jgi:hypothetical protein
MRGWENESLNLSELIMHSGIMQGVFRASERGMVELYSDKKIIGNALAAMNSSYIELIELQPLVDLDLLHIAQWQLILTSFSSSSLSTILKLSLPTRADQWPQILQHL